MAMFPLGATLGSLGLPVTEAFKRAAALGLAGVEISARGDFAPDALSRTGRRDLRHRLEREGLRLLAVDGRFTGCALSDPHRAQEAVDRTLPVLQLAADLRAPVVVTALGRLGPEPDSPTWRTAGETLLYLGDAADRFGLRLAPVTGPDDLSVLAKFLEGVEVGGIGLAYHPGRLKATGLDPVEGLEGVAAYLVHAYAADVESKPDGSWRSARVGEGEVDWSAVLGALSDVDYPGPLVIVGRAGPSAAGEVEAAVEFLRRF